MDLVIFFKTSLNMSKRNILNNYSSSLCVPSNLVIFVSFNGAVLFEKLHFVGWRFIR